MALVVKFADPVDAARNVDALLIAADAVEPDSPRAASRYRTIAHEYGAALDRLPRPPDTEAYMARLLA